MWTGGCSARPSSSPARSSCLARGAAEMAAEAGCNIARSVTKRVTMLVVGTQNRMKLKGYSKCSKHRKAEARIADGAEILILSETDFLNLMGLDL